VQFTFAGELLEGLAALVSATVLRRCLHLYVVPGLFFELMSKRYETKSTIVATNKAFSDWPEVFPNTACVASLVDRLTHHSEVI
jgi:hypothetical protein